MVGLFRLLIIAPLVACAAGDAAVAKPRGLWFWSKPASADGSVNIVGRAEREAEALATFRRWNVRRLYGSYVRLPIDSAAALAAWNRRLHDAGIQSASLFSNSAALTATGLADFLREIDERVLQFNAARPAAAERFDGIALDLEPHILDAWKTGTPADRRALLGGLLATFTALRAHLDAHGGRTLTIAAALPTWFDKLPPDGKIAWASAADRDEWFAHAGEAVSTISLMAYETNRPGAIATSTEWERAHFKGTAIIALRARLGVEWSSLTDLTRVLPEVESLGATGVDLENYELLRVAERAARR